MYIYVYIYISCIYIYIYIALSREDWQDLQTLLLEVLPKPYALEPKTSTLHPWAGPARFADVATGGAGEDPRAAFWRLRESEEEEE